MTPLRPDESNGAHDEPHWKYFFHHIPLFCAVLLFVGGIFVAQLWYFRPPLLLAATLAFVVVTLVSAMFAPRVVLLPVCLLWVTLGSWSAETAPQPAPSQPVHTLEDGLLRSVKGTVTSAEAVTNEADSAPAAQPRDATASSLEAATSQTFDLRVTRAESITDTMDAMLPVSDSAANQIRVTALWRARASTLVHCGDTVRVLLQLHPVTIYHDPDVWNRALYLASQKVSASGDIRADQQDRMAVLDRVGERRASCLLNQWRQSIASRINALPATMASLPSFLRVKPDDAAMLAAMLTGDRKQLNRPLRDIFERTGTFHLVVVSGLHLAILASIIFVLLERMRAPRIICSAVTFVCILVFSLFTGFAVPVQRSLWMITLYLIARLIYRRRSSLNLLGFAAICILAQQPTSILDASLQMTLLAVIAVGSIAVPLFQTGLTPLLRGMRNLSDYNADRLLTPEIVQFRMQLRWLAGRTVPWLSRASAEHLVEWAMWLLFRLAEIVWMSLVTELALALPMAIYFHRFLLFALPVNLLILPLIAILLPLILVLLLALLLWQPLSFVPAMASALLLHVAHFSVAFFAHQRWADIRLPAPSLLQSLVITAFVLASAYCAAHASSHWRQWTLPVLLLVLPVVLWPRGIQSPRSKLLFQAIDVGQGDSLLLITPDRHTLLVDGGGLLDYGRIHSGTQTAQRSFEIGEDVVSPILWSHSIRRLDTVVLTHAHTDHLGGLLAVVRNFHPRELWVGQNPATHEYQALLDEARQDGVRIRYLHRGDDMHLDRADFRVLAPALDYRPGAQPENDDSLVLRAQFGATSILLAGDAEAPEEDRMLATENLRSTILKVGHHGSRTSTQPSFLAAVSPRWAVISCGLHNHFGHPRPEVLAELQQAHVRTFRTDIDGTTCFTLDGEHVSAQPMCRPEFSFGATQSFLVPPGL